jgi:anti-sigma B factor antagonist
VETDSGPGQPGTIVVTLPAEIDYSNGQQVQEQLLAAFQPGVRRVVIDMMSVTFCDSAGLARIAIARRIAVARGAELRVAIREGVVTKIFEITGLDTLVPLYPSLDAALAPGT